jgi:hypothetical protein
LGLVVGVPEFAGDPEVLAGAESGIESGGNALADEFFISIVGGAVEVAVSGFDGLVDDLGREVFGDLPGSKAGRRKGGAIGKEVGGHCGGSLGMCLGLDD